MALASIYNHHRYARATLKKFRKAEASFIVQLHDDGWKFAGQEESLSYNGPMRPFLQAIRSQSIPSYLLPPLLAQDPPIPLYDGCIIVEVHDYRLRTGSVTPQQELSRRGTGVDHSTKHRLGASRRLAEQGGPALSAQGLIGVKSDTERKAAKKKANKAGVALDAGLGADGAAGGLGQFQKYRVVLRPDSETLWEFLCHYNIKNGRAVQGNADWDDEAMLQLEARILAATAPPLSLGTSILPTRIANVASALTRPTLDSMSFDGQFAGPSRSRQEETEDPNSAAADTSAGAIDAEDEDGQKPTASASEAPRKVTVLTTEADGKRTDEWLHARGLERQDLDVLLGGKEQYDSKIENPFASMQWVRRTLSFLSMRNPGGQIPSDVIITPVNLAGGAGPGGAPGSAGMRSADGEGLPSGPSAVEEKKKPSKKKKKPSAAAAAAAATASREATATPASSKNKPEPSESNEKKPAAAAASSSKSKSKKKKDDEVPPASAATNASASAGKKRTAEQMANGGDDQVKVEASAASVTVTPDKKGSAAAASGAKKSATKKASTSKDDVPPSPPVPTTGTPAQPPKKKAKKNANKDASANGDASATAAGAPLAAPAIDFAALASFIPPDAIPPGGGPIPEQAFLAAAQQYGNPNSLGAPGGPAGGGGPGSTPLMGMPVLPLQAQPPPPQQQQPATAAGGAGAMPDLSVLAGSSQDDIAAMVAALSGAGGVVSSMPDGAAPSSRQPPGSSRAPPGA